MECLNETQLTFFYAIKGFSLESGMKLKDIYIRYIVFNGTFRY